MALQDVDIIKLHSSSDLPNQRYAATRGHKNVWMVRREVHLAAEAVLVYKPFRPSSSGDVFHIPSSSILPTAKKSVENLSVSTVHRYGHGIATTHLRHDHDLSAW